MDSIQEAFERLSDEVWDDPQLAQDLETIRREVARLRAVPVPVAPIEPEDKRTLRKLQSAYRKGAQEAYRRAAEAMSSLISTEYRFATPMSRQYTEQARGIIGKLEVPTMEQEE